MNTSYLGVTISVNPYSFAEGKFGTRMSRSTSISAQINPRYRSAILASLAIRAGGRSTIAASVDPRLPSDIYGWILPRVTTNLPARIGVTPQSFMEATFDIYQPPPIVAPLTPTRDTFIRDGIKRINYGYEEEALIGSLNGEEFRGLFQFDLSSIPQGMQIKKAELRLYNAGGNFPVEVSINQITQDWPEYSTTWANQPDTKDYVKSIVFDGSSGYTNVDVLSTVKGWISLRDSGADEAYAINSHGFIVAPQQGNSGIIRVATKEATNVDTRPLLYIEYIDPIRRSRGLGKLSASIVVRAPGTQGLPASIKVDSHNIKENLTASITVPKHVGTPLSISASVTVSQRRPEYLQASIKVPIYPGNTAIPADIVCRAVDSTRLPASIKVPIYPGNTAIPADIICRAADITRLPASIKVPIYPGSDEIEATIECRVAANTPLPASILVPIYPGSDEIEVTLDVRVASDNAIRSSIEVPLYYANTSLPVELDVRVHTALQASISVRRSDSENLLAFVNTIAGEFLPADITVISGYLAASITVPTYESKDIPASLLVQVRYISDLECRIKTGSGAAPYAFIM